MKRCNSLLVSCLIWACIFLVDTLTTCGGDANEVASFTRDTAIVAEQDAACNTAFEAEADFTAMLVY